MSKLGCSQVISQRKSWQIGLLDAYEDDYLLSLGVPPDWLPVLRQLITEDDLLSILDKLPEEVAERLLQLALGELVIPPISPASSSIDNADTQRRFIMVKSRGELEKMLQAPMATWIGFLHPSQRRLVANNFQGPVKVTGSAGTGKTVVALHRARHLARQKKQVLLTTFVSTLCDNLKRNLNLLCTPEELDYITVETVSKQAKLILDKAQQTCWAVDDSEIKMLVEHYWSPECPLDKRSLWQEWLFVIQPYAIFTWNEYRSISRKGRGKPLSVRDRRRVWNVLEQVLTHLDRENRADWSHYYRRAADALTSNTASSPFDAVIVDEVQDLRPQALRFLSILAGDGLNRFVMVGDVGQRIYRGKFTLKSLGINIQGRSHTLKINYRTTEQIRRFADNVSMPDEDDLESDREARKATISVLQGPEPILKPLRSAKQQTEFVAEEIQKLISQGLTPPEIGVFARARYLLKPAQQRLDELQIPYLTLDQQGGESFTSVHLGTMHQAKGLEFKAVFAIHLSANKLPLPQALQSINDDQARAEAIERERHLLYVTITRARDLIYLCWQGKPTQFLEDILAKS